MRKGIASLSTLVAVTIALLIPGQAWGGAQEIFATSYSCTSCDTISGWDWLRTRGANATWIFNFPAPLAAPNGAFLYLDALVTDTVSGGAGYEAQIGLRLTNTLGRAHVWVTLENPFPFEDKEFSAGVGYPTTGVVKIPPHMLKTGSLMVSYDWGWWPPLRHVAVAESVLTICH